jgi:alpha-L-rhamnosidase
MPQWHAAMIAPDHEFDGAPLLRTETALDPDHGDVVEARLHLSAFGVAEAWINGEPVSAELLTPGWSSYEWRLRYRTLDVTALVGHTVVLGVALGNGWFRGRLGWHGNSRFYGRELAAWAQLEITFADGHRQVIATGPGTWRAGPGAVVANDLYDGQTVDARRRDDRWLRPGFDDGSWSGVHALEFDVARLTPYVGPPVTRQEEITPTRIWTSPAGATLLDFGQNLVGFVKVRVRGEAGTTVTLRHAEVLEHEELGIRPLRSALATDRFVLSGGDDEFEPTFTFHGFRYAEVSGWPGELGADAVTAVVIGSDLRRTGTFACSNPLMNQLHSNVVWGMRGNFVDVPSDCPQRDERLGWTGDLAVFAPSATYLYDAQGFLRDWLHDLAAEQHHHGGMIPFVVPDILKYEDLPEHFPEPETTAIWSDAGVWVPWALWQAYGDDTVLRDQFDSMTAHTRRVRSLLSTTGLWDQGFQFGDWLDPQAPPEEPFKARADTGVVATACAYRTAVRTAATARVLGRSDDAAEFDAMADALRKAFNDHYVEKGIVHSDCATVYALAIAFGLLDDDDRRLAGDRLAVLVVENGHRVSTGFAGTPFITDALTETGHLDEAYELLLEESCPSWLYPVTMGATTVWERWDSMLPDGTINPGEMTSFNHYALGAVADWLHRTVAGLAPLEPGYRTVLVEPRPGGGLTWAEATLESPHGPVSVRWDIRGSELRVDVTVPEGATAVVRLPGVPEQTVGPGAHHVVGAC